MSSDDDAVGYNGLLSTHSSSEFRAMLYMQIVSDKWGPSVFGLVGSGLILVECLVSLLER